LCHAFHILCFIFILQNLTIIAIVLDYGNRSYYAKVIDNFISFAFVVSLDRMWIFESPRIILSDHWVRVHLFTIIESRISWRRLTWNTYSRKSSHEIDRSVALMIIVSLRVMQLAWELRSSMLHASLGVYVVVVSSQQLFIIVHIVIVVILITDIRASYSSKLLATLSFR